MSVELNEQRKHIQMKLKIEDLEDRVYMQSVKRKVNESKQSERSYNQYSANEKLKNQSLL